MVFHNLKECLLLWFVAFLVPLAFCTKNHLAEYGTLFSPSMVSSPPTPLSFALWCIYSFIGALLSFWCEILSQLHREFHSLWKLKDRMDWAESQLIYYSRVECQGRCLCMCADVCWCVWERGDLSKRVRISLCRSTASSYRETVYGR